MALGWVGRRVAGLAATGTVVVCLTLALALGGRGASSATAAPAPQPPRPNVLVIETDDQDQASIRVMPKTQQLIGGQGVTFANSFVNYSLCCPSRATFLTGQYSHNHEVRDNGPPLGGFDRLNSTNTLPLWLQGAGYYTGLIGKYLNGYSAHRNDPGGPLIPPGWSEWRGTIVHSFYGNQLNEGGVLNTYGSATDNPDNPPDPSVYSTDLYTAKAVDLINRRAPSQQPFFLWLTYIAPHSAPPDTPGNHCDVHAKPAPRHLHAFDSQPLPRPPSFSEADMSDKPPTIRSDPALGAAAVATAALAYRCRMASLLAVDDGVERLVGALKAAGELDNTLVIFTSDNGFMHGEHRIRTGKIVPYEESIRVPLLIRGPGFRGGKTVRDLAINADITKTIVAATGARPGLRMDGVDLQGFAAQPGGERGRELSIESSAVLQNSYSGFQGVRTGRYIYLEYVSGQDAGFRELYDLDADPFQLQNVATNPAYASVRAALARRLAIVRGCSGDQCRLVPQLRIKLRGPSGPRGCARRPVRVRVKNADTSNIVLAEFFVNGKRVGADHKRPFQRKLPHGQLKRRQISKAKVRTTLLDGRRVTIYKNVRACR